MSDIQLAINLLPAIKALDTMEKAMLRLRDTFYRFKPYAKNPKTIDDSLYAFWSEYQKAVADIENRVESVATNLFYSIVNRTPKHTNRAAGSWAISLNSQDELSDLGFLPPENAMSVTFFNGGSKYDDWYPEAPVSAKGVKILGVHDWAWIQARHDDMVEKVTHEFTLRREWGQRDEKGRMKAHKTIFIYNSCPYIDKLESGSLRRDDIATGQMIALSVAEFESLFSSGFNTPNKGKQTKLTRG